MKRYGLYSQILVSMVAAACFVAILVGEYERRSEVMRLNNQLDQQAELTVSLLSGTMLEDIIVEDGPILETAMQEAINRIEQLISVRIDSYDGRKLAEVRSRTERHPDEISIFKRAIMFEDTSFGYITAEWSTREGQLMIAQSVGRARLTTLSSIVGVSALFLLLSHVFALRPLSRIHERMAAAINRNEMEVYSLPSYASRELHELNYSVSILERNLKVRDRREAELLKARASAEEASRVKSNFLANMSHEIRTPMNGVIGMADLLHDTDLDDDQIIYTETILSSGSALLEIINDILDFSKIEAGKMVLDCTRFNLRKQCEEILGMLSVTAFGKGVEVTMRYDPSLPDFYIGDSGRIRQIITNIAGNAVKFTTKGHGCLEVASSKEDGIDGVGIAVIDTGIGIPKEQISMIFKAFEQVDTADTREFEGTGLGLAISMRLATLMKGKIDVNSVPGQGSVFTFWVPLPTSDDQSEVDGPSDWSFDEKRILVVDDLELNRTILDEQLCKWGAEVTLASSGSDAVEILRQTKQNNQSFDVVVLDHHMPGMNGLEVAKCLRDMGGFANTPLVLLSSSGKQGEAHVRARLGIREVAIKPIRAAQLNQTVGRSLIADSKETEREPTLCGEGTVLPPLVILVAEDNKTNRLVVRSMLKSNPFTLILAENGQVAFDLFKASPPDIVLMDMSMPVMNGVDATREIRAWEAAEGCNRCPIIALTANARPADKKKCIDAGMDDFLSKPVKKYEMLSMCRKWSSEPHIVDTGSEKKR
jgi:signal transduction histidine kinase/CheY-like chemotaxis protein